MLILEKVDHGHMYWKHDSQSIDRFRLLGTTVFIFSIFRFLIPSPGCRVSVRGVT